MTAKKKQDETGAELAGSAGREQITVEGVLKALEEDGIRDLQQFIKRELARNKAEEKAPRRASMLGPSVGKPSRRGPAQRPVTVPVLIDGVLYDPKDIHRFDGQILHFVGPTGDRPLTAFTGDQWPTALQTVIQYRGVAGTLGWQNWVVQVPSQYPVYEVPTGGGGGGVVRYGPAEFFTDPNFEGDHLWLNWGWQWRDLTKVGRGDFWNRQSWNDCISSLLLPRPIVGCLVLCEDINLGGASFSCPNSDVRDLGPFGWGDRTSSIVYWE
jgi:hypothetical protein